MTEDEARSLRAENERLSRLLERCRRNVDNLVARLNQAGVRTVLFLGTAAERRDFEKLNPGVVVVPGP